MQIQDRAQLLTTGRTGLDLPLACAWRSANAEARRTYRAWQAAPRERKAEAYYVYVAAADRADAAAAALIDAPRAVA